MNDLLTLKEAAHRVGRPLADLEALAESGALSWRYLTVRGPGPVRYYLLAEVRVAVARHDLKTLGAA